MLNMHRKEWVGGGGDRERESVAMLCDLPSPLQIFRSFMIFFD